MKTLQNMTSATVRSGRQHTETKTARDQWLLVHLTRRVGWRPLPPSADLNFAPTARKTVVTLLHHFYIIQTAFLLLPKFIR